jgi:hypothetical protein
MNLIPPLKSDRTNTSNINLQNDKHASLTEMEFNIQGIYSMEQQFLQHLPQGKRDSLQDTLEHMTCCLIVRMTGGSRSTFVSQYDVIEYISMALMDATKICNFIIAKIAIELDVSVPLCLSTTRVSSIFSNIYNSLEVYDVTSGAPVFGVEMKPFSNFDATSETVIEQCMDQLRFMQQKGHPNPFAAISCFNQTRIVWLNTTAHNEVLERRTPSENNNLLSRLQRIVRSLPGVVNLTNNETPSQPTIVNNLKNTGCTTRNEFTPDEERSLICSQEFEQTEIIYALLHAIMCSLDGFVGARQQIDEFEMNQTFEINDVMKLNIDSLDWGKLSVTYNGPLQFGNDTVQLEHEREGLYLVHYLGYGATSKVHRALTIDGYDCVVKMYVQHCDDDRATVDQELNEYKEIYGDELKDYVRTITLNDMPCIIMPFFKPIKNDERNSVIHEIKKRLNELFVTKKKSFQPTDQSWRHIGTFNNKIYLFDLADLTEHDTTLSAQQSADEHVACLQCKLAPAPSTPNE